MCVAVNVALHPWSHRLPMESRLPIFSLEKGDSVWPRTEEGVCAGWRYGWRIWVPYWAGEQQMVRLPEQSSGLRQNYRHNARCIRCRQSTVCGRKRKTEREAGRRLRMYMWGELEYLSYDTCCRVQPSRLLTCYDRCEVEGCIRWDFRLSGCARSQHHCAHRTGICRWR
jgi:hypothetical protein